MMNIKVLGTGCMKCKSLEEKVRQIAQDNNLVIDVEKVTDLNKIMDYRIMMTPGLVVNGEVKSSGRVPKDSEILKWIKEE
ncbi:thioredoxin family protein [Candidatus Neomarinimicrobiota bacterium]